MLKILSRVPGRSLVRFRGVLSHGSHFISRRLNHAAKNSFFCFSHVSEEDKVALYSFEIVASKAVFGNKLTVPVVSATDYRMTNSCNGLIAFYGMSFAYVANPCTREWMALPEFTDHRIGNNSRSMQDYLGLGFSMATGKYKVVRFVHRRCWYCEVLTIGTDSSWRLLGEMPCPFTEFIPAYANGYIYWTIGGEREDQFDECILAFDVSQEVFMMIWPPECDPEHYDDDGHWFMSVLEGGSVRLIDWRMFVDDKERSYSAVMHTHVLKDHVDCRWSKSHSIWLRGMKLDPRSRCFFDDSEAANNMFPIAIQNGKVLLYRPYHSWRLHDLHTGTCSKIDLSHLKELTCMGRKKKKELIWTNTYSRPFACAESIVRITN